MIGLWTLWTGDVELGAWSLIEKNEIFFQFKFLMKFHRNSAKTIVKQQIKLMQVFSNRPTIIPAQYEAVTLQTLERFQFTSANLHKIWKSCFVAGVMTTRCSNDTEKQKQNTFNIHNNPKWLSLFSLTVAWVCEHKKTKLKLKSRG